jgi:hypothetical protein
MNMIKKQDFFHNGVKYSFNWDNTHLPKDSVGVEKLRTYFSRIEAKEIPEELFQSKKVPRISQFRLNTRPFARAWDILSQHLINDGLIIQDPASPYVTRVKTIFLNYASVGINETPKHSTILKNFLIKDARSIAIEVPLWENNLPITGHADLIQFHEGIIVADYKPENHFLISLPQVATYGVLLAKQFQLPVKCISFSNKNAWEYSPNILMERIIPFMERNNRPLDWFQIVKKLNNQN